MADIKAMRIVSGGQTGVDRAALDAALELGLACGGWCPKGRWAEDGEIPAHYPLKETPSTDPATRTRANVKESDATLVLTDGEPTDGTRLAMTLAGDLHKPCLCIDFTVGADIEAVRNWITETGAEVLNVAGPRESNAPGIYEMAHGFLVMALAPWARTHPRPH
jgi:hypothetical protein